MNEYTPPILIKDLGMKAGKNSENKKRYGLYKCFCGQEFEAYTNNVAIGGTKSCGCLRKNRGKK